jgi:hypothetical protein
MRSLLLVLPVMACNILKSQDTSDYSYAIKTELSALFPNIIYSTGRLHAEVEKSLPNRRSIVIGAGYIYSYGASRSAPLLSLSVNQETTRGYKANIEYRKYLNRHKVFQPLCLLIWPLALQLNGVKDSHTGLYVSGQANYQQTFSEVLRNYIEYTEERYLVNRVNPSLLFRFGFQTITKNRIIVDQSLGVGIQYSSCFSSGPVEANMVSWMNNPGSDNNFFPAINYSFKVGIGR